nr:ferric reductase-like transmembrane domain-containing protein [Micromonospora sp. DSM 115978]
MSRSARTANRRPPAARTRRRPAPAGPTVPEPRGRWGARLVGAVLWLGLLGSVLPWWQQTPAGSLRDTPAILTAGGQVTGLVAGYLLLVQILLMSRLRLLERTIGTEQIARWHRDVGASLLVAVLAHTALIVVGYAGVDRVSITAEIGLLWNNYEDLPSAFLATGILVFVAFTSIRAARKAVPYELWHFLHLSSYAALLFGYGHQFANGQQLFQPGPVRTFWIGMYVAVLAALVWGRMIVPLRFNLRHRLEVADVVAESPDTISIYLIGNKLDRLEVRGGQFFRWRFLARGCWWQSHPFSLSAAQNGRWLRITVKIVGQHTADLRDLEPGTRVWAEGPLGTFNAEHRTRERALLIAGGSGIAPIRALLEELPPGSALIYRASKPEDVMLYRELDWLADARGVDLRYVVGSRNDPGPRQVMTPRGLRYLVPDLSRRDVFLCGPAGLVEESVKLLRRAGVPKKQIHLATFEL